MGSWTAGAEPDLRRYLMPDFTLILEIDANDLVNIKAAGLYIIVAKPVNNSQKNANGNIMPSNNTKPNVAWVVFDPFQHNTVEWTEAYGIYVSTTKVCPGKTIIKMGYTPSPATDGGSYYSFTTSNTFNGPFTGSNGAPVGSYAVVNNMPSSQYQLLTFGLEQKVTINDKVVTATLVNGENVMATFSISFTPSTKVYIWLQSSIVAGTVIKVVPTKAANVTFGGGVTEKTLKFNAVSGSFIPVPSNSALVEAPNVNLFNPTAL